MFTYLLTPRLMLRRLQLTDTGAMFAYRSDPLVARYQGWEVPSREKIQAFIQEQLNLEMDTPGTWFQVGITLRASGDLLGDCGLHFPQHDPRQAEVGITLARTYQGKGYASEALAAVLRYIFMTLGKHRVTASVDPRNKPSLVLMEHLGFRQEAHFRQSLWFKGEWADDIIFGLLESEWKARN